MTLIRCRRHIIIQGHHNELFEGFQYRLEDWLAAAYPKEREAIRTPSDRAKQTIKDANEKAILEGWPGKSRPKNDPYTDWTVLNDCGAHTVIWKIPSSGQEFIFYAQYITGTDMVPSGIDENTMSANFKIPYEWASEETKPKLRFAGGELWLGR